MFCLYTKLIIPSCCLILFSKSSIEISTPETAPTFSTGLELQPPPDKELAPSIKTNASNATPITVTNNHDLSLIFCNVAICIF